MVGILLCSPRELGDTNALHVCNQVQRNGSSVDMTSLDNSGGLNKMCMILWGLETTATCTNLQLFRAI